MRVQPKGQAILEGMLCRRAKLLAVVIDDRFEPRGRLLDVDELDIGRSDAVLGHTRRQAFGPVQIKAGHDACAGVERNRQINVATVLAIGRDRVVTRFPGLAGQLVKPLAEGSEQGILHVQPIHSHVIAILRRGTLRERLALAQPALYLRYVVGGFGLRRCSIFTVTKKPGSQEACGANTIDAKL